MGGMRRRPPGQAHAGRSPASATASTNASAACRATATGSGSTVTFTPPGQGGGERRLEHDIVVASVERPAEQRRVVEHRQDDRMLRRRPCRRPGRPARGRARSMTNSDSAQDATRSTCGRSWCSSATVRSRREPSQPASSRASLTGPWTSTACSPAAPRRPAAGRTATRSPRASGSSRSQARSVDGRLEPPTVADALERRHVRVDDGRRGEPGQLRQHLEPVPGSAPCHHTNVGRSVTSSDSTALGSASRPRRQEDLLGAHLLHPAAEPARGRDAGAHAVLAGPATIARSGRLPPIRSSASLGAGDVLRRRRVDDQVERGRPHGCRGRPRGWPASARSTWSRSVTSTGPVRDHGRRQRRPSRVISSTAPARAPTTPTRTPAASPIATARAADRRSPTSARRRPAA